jgi:dolichyl-phosphate beta-glucosyltransferase
MNHPTVLKFPSPCAAGQGISDHELTVVIPAYNEKDRLPQTLDTLRDYLNDWGLNYRVVVADDGSRDGTATVAATFGPRFSTISLPRNQGKGAAVRAGVLSATGRVIAFTDADLPYALESLRAGYERVSSGNCRVAFGARDLKESGLRVRRRVLRRMASSIFGLLVKTFISRRITDTQAGLKVFDRDAAREIFSRTTIDGFAFDVEVAHLTERLGLSYRRIPVVLINERSSTLSLRRHTLPMLVDIFRIRFRALRGTYDLTRDHDQLRQPVESTKRAAA